MRLTVSAVVVMLAGSLMAAGAAGAQGTTPTQRQGHERIVKTLGLSAEQQAQIKTVRGQYKGQVEQDHAKIKADIQAWKQARVAHDTASMHAARARIEQDRSERKAAAQARRTAVEGVLTPDQKAKFEADVAARQAQKGERKEARKAGRKQGNQ